MNNKFNVGDRVEVVSDYYACRSLRRGAEGTVMQVVYIIPEKLEGYYVDMDNTPPPGTGDPGLAFFEYELEKADA